MAKLNLIDLSKNVMYDDSIHKYKLISFKNMQFHVENLIESKLSKDKIINLPTISEISLNCYPFIEKLNKDIVQSLINRNKKINRLIFNAIDNKNSYYLTFDPLDEKDKFIINLAKSVTHDINKFIYKYEIKNMYSNKTFINNDFNLPFIGSIDMLAQSDKGWYLVSFKMSRSGYTQKYSAELFLQKQLFESNTKFKVIECIILNPRDERVFKNINNISNNEIFKMNEYIVSNF